MNARARDPRPETRPVTLGGGMRRAVSAVMVSLAVAAVVAGLAMAARGETPIAVTVNLNAERQVIDGFGTSTRVWTDPHVPNFAVSTVPGAAQDEILTALYGRLGLTRARPVLDPGIQKQKGGPFDFSGKLGEAHIAFVKQAKLYGLRTVFPGPVYLEDWMTPADPESYVAWAMTVLRRWRQGGVELALFAPLNEPEIARDFPAEWMRQVVRMLGPKMRAAGFKTMLVVPDDENPDSAYERATAVLADPAARRYVGALAYHIYKGGPVGWARMRSLAASYRLPVWMTEYSTPRYGDWQGSLDWAVRMHTLLTVGGVSAVDYLWGFFGEWVRTDTLISIDFDGGTYRGFRPMPTYWITGQYSRYVRPGYVRVGTSVGVGDVLASGFAGAKRVVVVAVNPSGTTRRVKVAVVGGGVRGVVRPVRSSSTEQWRSLAPLPLRSGAFAAVLPPASVTTFIVTRTG